MSHQDIVKNSVASAFLKYLESIPPTKIQKWEKRHIREFPPVDNNIKNDINLNELQKESHIVRFSSHSYVWRS